MFPNVYPREKYLSRIRPFYDSDIIKVITGIRRCGKSFILKGIMNELIGLGIPSDSIIYLPLDNRGFKSIKTPEQLENKIESMIKSAGLHYLFIDEIQNVKGFEEVVQAYAEEGFSVFLTGSNSYLLSDEITTKLTGTATLRQRYGQHQRVRQNQRHGHPAQCRPRCSGLWSRATGNMEIIKKFKIWQN